MALMTRDAQKTRWLICLLAILPALRLGRGFAGDWRNFLWFMSYTGEHLWQHVTLPLVFNTQEVVGLPFPIFYGALFTRLSALPTMVLGSGLTFRLFVFGILLVQFICIERLVHEISGNLRLAQAVACCLTLSTYQLTNLYSRSAAMEFVAFACLVSSLCLILLMISRPERFLRWHVMGMAFFTMTLGAGSHPITVVYGGAAAGLVIVSTFHLCRQKRKLVMMAMPFLGLSLICLAPWLYATIKMSSLLEVSRSSTAVNLIWNPSVVWWMRLLPIPFDPRMGYTARDPRPVHVDTQISIPLLLLAIYVLVRGAKEKSRNQWIAWLNLSVAAFLYWCSASLAPWTWVPSIFKYINFPYRLTNYINLFLFISSIVCLVGLKKVEPKRLIAVLSVLTFMSYGIKLVHSVRAYEVTEEKYCRIFSNKDGLIHAPTALYSIDDYADVKSFEPLPSPQNLTPVSFSVGHGKELGQVSDVVVNAQAEQFVTTNVQSFLWNTIYLDGQPAKTYMDRDRLALQVHQGQHVLSYRFEPDRKYIVLEQMSTWLFFLWAVVVVTRACLPYLP